MLIFGKTGKFSKQFDNYNFDPRVPQLRLAQVISWPELDHTFANTTRKDWEDHQAHLPDGGAPNSEIAG
jgi:hypothetical protein